MAALGQVLSQLPEFQDKNLIAGRENFEDAGVYRVSPDLAVVQTVDFFPPLVDDPYLYGQISAANSLSDIYAMGGIPRMALNIATFPDDCLDTAILKEIFEGGSSKLVEAECSLVGGQTVTDKGIKYGLAVTGFVHPDKALLNSKGQSGDVLILTKPLGTGIITAASFTKGIAGRPFEAACQYMSTLNRYSIETALEFDVHTATDITGNGFLGHAWEVASASNITLKFYDGKIPRIEGSRELASRGFFSKGVNVNFSFLKGKVWYSPEVPELNLNELLDSQTSGGLLICLSPQNAESCLKRFKEKNLEAWEVGETVAFTGNAVELHP